MSKVIQTDRGGAIVTRRLPRICPACAFPAPTETKLFSRSAGGEVSRLTCARTGTGWTCGWTADYIVDAGAGR